MKSSVHTGPSRVRNGPCKYHQKLRQWQQKHRIGEKPTLERRFSRLQEACASKGIIRFHPTFDGTDRYVPVRQQTGICGQTNFSNSGTNPILYIDNSQTNPIAQAEQPVLKTLHIGTCLNVHLYPLVKRKSHESHLSFDIFSIANYQLGNFIQQHMSIMQLM